MGKKDEAFLSEAEMNELSSLLGKHTITLTNFQIHEHSYKTGFFVEVRNG